jgi:Ca-activated chloride channel family protein
MEAVMDLTTPWLLPLGLLAVGALVVGTVVTGRRRVRVLASAGVLGRSAPPPVPAGRWLSFGGLAVLALAMAGPTVDVPTPRSAGTVIMAIDVSQSMTATDVAPSRLEAAKEVATTLIEAQPDSVDIGVVAFGAGALSAGEPSADHARAAAAVARLTPSGGTSLAGAIVGSLSAITGKTVTLPEEGAQAPDLGYWSSATVVLVSDGETTDAGDATEAAAALALSAGVHIETVGVGTASGTTVDADGYVVHTALDEDALTAIAETTGGEYHPSSQVADVMDLADSIDRRLTVAPEPLPLAGPLGGLAAVLLALGSARALIRHGRLI